MGLAAVAADHPIHRTTFPEVTHQCTGIDTSDAHHLMGPHPVLQRVLAAPVAVQRSELPCDHATGVRLISLLVIGIDSGVAQFRVGKGDQLTVVAGIGEHLLVAGHAGVEDHFSDHGTAMAETMAREHGPIRQNEMCLRCRGLRHQANRAVVFTIHCPFRRDRLVLSRSSRWRGSPAAMASSARRAP